MIVWLTQIANIIIVGGAVYMVFVNITKNTSDGLRWYERKRNKDFRKKINECMESNTPDYFNDIKHDLIEIKTDLTELKDDVKLLKRSNTDVLRREINKIYNKYRMYKKITQYDKTDVIKLSNDYFAEDGNSYVRDLLKQISQWEVVQSIDDIEGFIEE